MPAEGAPKADASPLSTVRGARWIRGLFLPAFAVAGFGWSLAGGAVRLVTALPRIADALESLAALATAADELSQLRGAVERIEQLGTFVATELPESAHQLEAVLAQLGVLGVRLGELNQAMLNLTLTPRELDRVRRELLGTMTPLEQLADRLETLTKSAAPRQRTPRSS